MDLKKKRGEEAERKKEYNKNVKDAEDDDRV